MKAEINIAVAIGFKCSKKLLAVCQKSSTEQTYSGMYCEQPLEKSSVKNIHNCIKWGGGDTQAQLTLVWV